MFEKSIAEEIAQVNIERPHVFLLGAGASLASFPTGDRNGRRLPLMYNFVDVVPVRDILVEAGIPFEGRNFEEIYAELAKDSSKAPLRFRLEQVVFDYFASLRLPDAPTLYDHLILSLRPKDVIATFNWDPFLIQAAIRNGRGGEIPRLLFLHGNVLSGYCERDHIHGLCGRKCSKCGQPLRQVRLLFPIGEKDYQSDPAIRSNWEAVKFAFENAFMVTIFGYGAPKSDRSAVELLQDAWGSPKDRNLEQFEIIDIRDEDSLIQSWRSFIHTHHYEVHNSFYDSWIAKHPRRSGEAYWNQYLEAMFIEDNPLPQDAPFPELWEWFKPLLDAERRAEEKNQDK